MENKTRTIILIVIALLFIGVVIFGMTKKDSPQGEVIAWNDNMTMGSRDAAHHFIVYTDVFCPYCDNFSRVLEENTEALQEEYLDTGDVFLEYRMTDMISDHSENSTRGGEAAYCAAEQGKFWEFYEAILAKLWDDYHSKGIGTSKTSPEIPKLDDEYYISASDEVDKDALKTCLDEHQTLETLKSNTRKASRLVNGGVPYFAFDGWTGSGFEGNWSTVKAMFAAGMK
ncbi:MAG: DsbA family protein [Candidatus Nomurabacteria bacterium]|jgi:protein-disulfide isomerase|nr:DsbA family protein [Candidatus Nomurabacteria bacterium]